MFLNSCFPQLPHPALCIILSHLIEQKGLMKIENLSENPDEEKDHILMLYSVLSRIYTDLKVIMFYVKPNVEIGDFSLRIQKLEETLLNFSSCMQPRFGQFEEHPDA